MVVYEQLCPSGYYCESGTEWQNREINICQTNKYCPAGVSKSTQIQCPEGTSCVQGCKLAKECKKMPNQVVNTISTATLLGTDPTIDPGTSENVILTCHPKDPTCTGVLQKEVVGQCSLTIEKINTICSEIKGLGQWTDDCELAYYQNRNNAGAYPYLTVSYQPENVVCTIDCPLPPWCPKAFAWITDNTLVCEGKTQHLASLLSSQSSDYYLQVCEGTAFQSVPTWGLRPFETAIVTFNFTGIAGITKSAEGGSGMVYPDHFRIAFYEQSDASLIQSSDSQPWHDYWAQASNVQSQMNDLVFSFAITSLDYTYFRFEIQILHGYYQQKYSHLFNNTVSVEFTKPKYIDGTFSTSNSTYTPKIDATFYSVFLETTETAMPLNLPQFGGIVTDSTSYKTSRWLSSFVPESEGKHLGFSNTAFRNTRLDFIPHKAVDSYTNNLPNDASSLQLLSQIKPISDRYWDNMALVPFPWIPHIMHCEPGESLISGSEKKTVLGFGKYLPFNLMMENPDGCSLPDRDDPLYSANIWPAMQWFSPRPVLADSCNYFLNCRYMEDHLVSDAYDKWYEAPTSTMIFTVTEDPISFSTLQEDMHDAGQVGTSTSSVAFNKFNQMNTDQTLAWVRSVRSGFATGKLPANVTFSIQYYQATPATKKLLRLDFILSDYYSFDTDPTRYLYATATSFRGGLYKFFFKMEALSWMEVLNFFGLPAEIYVIFFFVVSFGILIGISTLWSLLRLVLIGRVSSGLHFFEYLLDFNMSPVKGFMYACMPTAVGSLIIWVLFVNVPTASVAFYGVPGTWNFDQVEETALKPINAGGRAGLCLCMLGVEIMSNGVLLLIPKRDKISPLWRPFHWQQSHTLFISMFMTLITIFVVEFSYTTLFSQNTASFMIMFKVAFIFVETFLGKVLGEKLIIAPFILAQQLVQFTITLGAEGFLTFIYANLIELASDTFKRATIDPIKLRMVRQAREEVAIQVALKQGLPVPERLPDDKAMKMDVVTGLYLYFTSTIALIFAPLCIGFMYLFRDPLYILKYYNIRDKEMIYYLQFAAILIPTQLVVDIFLSNIIECIHSGWRQYDYLKECSDRFKNRTRRWMGLETHDNNWMAADVRSLDTMAFCPQYFFMVSFHAGGILTCAYGFSMVMKAGASEYSVMQDPIAVPLMVMTSIACGQMKKVFIGLANATKLWVVKGSDKEEEDANFQNIADEVYDYEDCEGKFDANLGDIRKVLLHLTGLDYSPESIGNALRDAGMVDKDGVLITPTFEADEKREKKERLEREARHQAARGGVLIRNDGEEPKKQEVKGEMMWPDEMQYGQHWERAGKPAGSSSEDGNVSRGENEEKELGQEHWPKVLE
eukprot:c21590_g1_i3.p1 GENE.c21590_g1_i3~~c21590_g1_i3.p1  ORF type:complete len:1349 (+),score=588.27 c21590_g1_i3:276-4322(+)